MAKASDNQFPKVTFAESTAPSTPASGLGYLYEKTDGILYFKNDAGTESVLGQTNTLYDTTLTGTATSIDTGAVLGGYKHLRVHFQGRTDRAAQVFEGVNIQFNADTGANYDSVNSDFFGTADQVDVGESIGGTSGLVGSITGATGLANTPGAFVIDIPNYGSTTFHKTYMSVGGVAYAASTTNLHNVIHSGKWRPSPGSFC
jgi:hypothetical protein